ncbi:Mgp12 protein [Martiniozyma asiatica (nom. inval.)]|nr:Mgp12 protein [Martiniozyma asiatica]
MLKTGLSFKPRPFLGRSISNISLTLFSKPQCQLCDHFHQGIDRVIQKLPQTTKDSLKIKTIDISAKGNEKFFECYRYDIPVMWIEREGVNKVTMMHRLNEEEFMDELTQDL